MFGLISRAQYEADLAQKQDIIESLQASLEDSISREAEESKARQDAIASLEEYKNRYNASVATNDDLQKKLDELMKLNLQDLQNENEQIRAESAKLKIDLDEQQKINEDVQKALSKALHESVMWGFPENDVFPGCISVHTRESQISDDERYIVVQGRTIFTDEMNNKLKDAKTNLERFDMILLALKKYGIYDRIVKDLMLRSGIVYTLAYNEECSAYEIYYQITAKKEPTEFKVEFDIPE